MLRLDEASCRVKVATVADNRAVVWLQAALLGGWGMRPEQLNRFRFRSTVIVRMRR